ncbi:hypothetical protein KNE206_57590 [Kitasatospora sp. NE20-6]
MTVKLEALQQARSFNFRGAYKHSLPSAPYVGVLRQQIWTPVQIGTSGYPKGVR